jgi:acetyl esterase/lipase
MASRWFDSPLTAFNAFVLKDLGGRLLARDLAYGDHPRQQLDLYSPRRPPGRKALPIIAFFYGGSWASGVRQGYGFVGRALAARGFLVAVADYRLVPEVRFPAFIEDAAGAVRWLIAHAGAHKGDPGRLVLMGHSAGAYNAAMAALDPQWLGPDRSRIAGLIGLAGPYDFLPLSGAVTKAAFADADDLEATQPVRFAGEGAPPTLLLHGGQDRTVLPRNSKRLARAIAAGGGAARLKIYPQVGHVAILTALALPFRYRALVLADAVAFAKEVCER